MIIAIRESLAGDSRALSFDPRFDRDAMVMLTLCPRSGAGGEQHA
jgi:hypothetical protein